MSLESIRELTDRTNGQLETRRNWSVSLISNEWGEFMVRQPKRILSITIIAVYSLFTVFTFQNCGTGFEVVPSQNGSLVSPSITGANFEASSIMNLSYYAGQQIAVTPNLEVDTSVIHSVKWAVNDILIQSTPNYADFSILATKNLTGKLSINFVYNGQIVTESVAQISVVDSPTAPVAPTVETQPFGAAALKGDRASLSVAFLAYPLASIQWYKDGHALQHQTNSYLLLKNLGPADAGNYYAKISNAQGQVVTDYATLAVDIPYVPAKILSPIGNQDLHIGDPLNVQLQFEGMPTPTITWYFNNVKIGGSSTSQFRIPVLGINQQGNYRVVVSNLYLGQTYQDKSDFSVNLSCLLPNTHIESGTCMANSQSCSVANGSGTKTWTGAAYSACQVSSCNSSYHIESSQCFSDSKTCAISNGSGSQQWTGASYGACQAVSCNSSYHIESGTCMANSQSCSVANGAGAQTWNGAAYGACAVTSCNSSFHNESGQCQSNTRACSIANGTGSEIWNSTSYSACQATACNGGFHIDSGLCTSNTQSCPVVNGTGTRSWDGSAWGICQVANCSNDYHVESNQCRANSQTCTGWGGLAGTQLWNGGDYGSCTVCKYGQEQSCWSSSAHASGTQTCSADGTSFGLCQICKPSSSYACWTPDLDFGSQTCAADGSFWGACQVSCVPSSTKTCILPNVGGMGVKQCNSAGSAYSDCFSTCAPASSQICITSSGGAGSQVCSADGSGYGACSASCSPGAWSACFSGYQQCNNAGTNYGVCGACKSGDTMACSTGIPAAPNGQRACVVDNVSGSRFSNTCTPISSGSPGFCSPGAQMGQCLTSAISDWISLGSYASYTESDTTHSKTYYGTQFCNSAGTGLTGICKICEPGKIERPVWSDCNRNGCRTRNSITCNADGTDFDPPIPY